MSTTQSAFRKCISGAGSAFVAATGLSLTIVAVMIVVSALAASRAAEASAQQKASLAITSARSGAEIILYIMQEMRGHSSDAVAAGMPMSDIKTALEKGLANLEMMGVCVTLDGRTIAISSATLNDSTGQSFIASITCDDGVNLVADVTGLAGDVSRTCRLKCSLATGAHLIFDPPDASRNDGVMARAD
jgi:hypothetical protein